MLPAIGIDFGFALGADEAPVLNAGARSVSIRAAQDQLFSQGITGSDASVVENRLTQQAGGGVGGGMPTWLLIAGGVAVLGAGYVFMKRRRRGGAVAGYRRR